MGQVRTVLGDLSPRELGCTDYHEHLFQVTPLLPGDELDDEGCSGREAVLLTRSGFNAMVEATPLGLGRNPEAVARISVAAGLSVVMTTGVHREAHYPPGHWLHEQSASELAGRFVRELERAVPLRDDDPGTPALTPSGDPVRAGVLKAGIGYWSISDFEAAVLHAVSEAHGETGAPVMVHLEHGSAAFELLDRLAQDGVTADRVVLAHIDRNPDPGLHAELAATGAYLGYDGAARTQRWPDNIILDCLAATCDRGGATRVLLGGDVARRRRYVSYGGMPGLAYLGKRFIPRVRAALGQATLDLLLRDNPARWLAWSDQPALT